MVDYPAKPSQLDVLQTLVAGLTPVLVAAATSTKATVKAAPTNLELLQAWNPNSTVAYVQVFDALAANVTVGTTVPKLSIPIAPTSNGGFSLGIPGIAFAVGIVIAVTTTATGSTSPTVAVDVNLAVS